MADGRKVLDLAAFHPATARFLCLKLCRYFVSDTPPQSLVDSAAKVWIDNAKKPDQIAAVVKHIALSKEFAASRGCKPKSPLALAASFARVTGIDLTPTHAAHQPARAMRPAAVRLAHAGRAAHERGLLPHARIFARTLGAGHELAANAWNNGQPKALLAAKAQPRRPATRLARWLTRFAGPGVCRAVPGRAWHGAGAANPTRNGLRRSPGYAPPHPNSK